MSVSPNRRGDGKAGAAGGHFDSFKLRAFLFHLPFWPFYQLARLALKRSIIATVCPIRDGRRGGGEYRRNCDYVRHRTLGMLAEEARRRLEGADYCVAEVGVFRGDFAAAMQRELPGRRLFLFDTFQGFPEADKKLDLALGLSKPKVYREMRFETTSSAAVLRKMPEPENCEICQGNFPDTVTDRHKTLAWGFVSLDVDLYKPMLDGLRFFYPALLPGGYILIHDYNNPDINGVRRAVEEFEAETGGLAKVPLADSYGTLIITK